MKPPRPRPRLPALTEAHLGRVAREVAELPPLEGMTPLTDEDRETLAARLLADNAGRPFWLFAYGSLIWKPAFEHVEARNCIAHGWRRAFCLDMRRHRATPERPGLMLALAHGGACHGIAYRMPDDAPHERMLRLLQREMGSREAIPTIRWLTVRGGGETFRALAFYCMPRENERLLHLPLPDQARRLALAVGPAGSNAEYLRNTVVHLEDCGIHDRYLWRLQALVAAEIDLLDGDGGPSTG